MKKKMMKLLYPEIEENLSYLKGASNFNYWIEKIEANDPREENIFKKPDLWGTDNWKWYVNLPEE